MRNHAAPGNVEQIISTISHIHYEDMFLFDRQTPVIGECTTRQMTPEERAHMERMLKKAQPQKKPISLWRGGHR